MKYLPFLTILLLFSAKAFAKEKEAAVVYSDFVAQEAEFIAQDDEDLEFDIEDITEADLNLSKDEAIMWQRDKERHENNVKKQKKIAKRLSIDYKRLPNLPNIITPDNDDNAHIPKHLYQKDYEQLALTSAKDGNVNGLRLALDNNVDINSIDTQGNSLLVTAVISGQIDTVRLLLARGADDSITDANGNTPLHLATIRGYQKIRNSLLAISDHGHDEAAAEDEANARIAAAAAAAAIEAAAREARKENSEDLEDLYRDEPPTCPVCPICTNNAKKPEKQAQPFRAPIVSNDSVKPIKQAQPFTAPIVSNDSVKPIKQAQPFKAPIVLNDSLKPVKKAPCTAPTGTSTYKKTKTQPKAVTKKSAPRITRKKHHKAAPKVLCNDE